MPETLSVEASLSKKGSEESEESEESDHTQRQKTCFDRSVLSDIYIRQSILMLFVWVECRLSIIGPKLSGSSDP